MDKYLATIQTILNRCEKDGTDVSVDDMKIINDCVCGIIKTRFGITQCWFIPLVEKLQKAYNDHYDNIDRKWDSMVNKNN